MIILLMILFLKLMHQVDCLKMSQNGEKHEFFFRSFWGKV